MCVWGGGGGLAGEGNATNFILFLFNLWNNKAKTKYVHIIDTLTTDSSPQCLFSKDTICCSVVDCRPLLVGQNKASTVVSRMLCAIKTSDEPHLLFLLYLSSSKQAFRKASCPFDTGKA